MNLKAWIALVCVLLTSVAGCSGGQGDTAGTPPASNATGAAQGGMRGSGADLAVTMASPSIQGYRSNYTIVQANGAVTVTSRINPADVQVFHDIKLLKFFDKYVSFDVAGQSGQVYRLYQAAFNRKPDEAGLGFWIKAAETGTDLISISGSFIESDEFIRLYGAKVPASSFVSSLYLNVLHRAGDISGFNWWTDQVVNGADRRGVLTGFSESKENKDNLMPDMVNGFEYEPYQPAGPIIPKRTSYANAKNLAPISLPREAEYASAYVQADFMQNGTMALFTGSLTYTPDNPISQATPGLFSFWTRNASGAWVKQDNMIIEPQTGCIHPRKAIVADFNNDGRPDVLVACQGYDAAPWPGEPMVLLTSTPEGRYHYTQMTEFKGFFHAAAAADVNHDGLIDIVATDTQSPDSLRMLINKGNGTFEERKNVFPAVTQHRLYFTVELVDANQDGKLDLLVGGHEWQGDSRALVIYGNGTENFHDSQLVTIPAVANQGVVLDFVVTSKGLVLNRTSGGGASFYNSEVIQLVNLQTMTAEVVYETNTGAWFPWLVLTSTGVASANLGVPATVVF